MISYGRYTWDEKTIPKIESPTFVGLFAPMGWMQFTNAGELFF
jgi:hypothetical protein